MIHFHLTNLTLKEIISCLNLWLVRHSLTAGMVHMKLENHHCHRCLLQPKSRWIHRKCQLQVWVCDSLPSSLIPAMIVPLHANDGSLFSLHWEHPVVPRTTTLAAKPTVNWLLCCAFMGLALPRYWGKYRPSNKQFMTWSNFDLGPPEMPLPSENEKIQTCGDIKQWLAVCVKRELGQDKTRVTSCDLTGYFRIHAFILIFYPPEQTLFRLSTGSISPPGPVTWSGFAQWFQSTAWGGIPYLLQGCALPCLAFLHQHMLHWCLRLQSFRLWHQ